MSETTTTKTTRTRKTALKTDAATASDASVLNGVRTTAAKPSPAPKAAPAEPKTPAEPKVTGPAIWATKEVTPAMANFTRWIAREYPDLKIDTKPGSRDARLVMIASKAYRFFQASDLNK